MYLIDTDVLSARIGNQSADRPPRRLSTDLQS